jgi:hypothetical protein
MGIFNSTGQRIKQLNNKSINGLVKWDLKDDFGKKVPDGIYIISVILNGDIHSQQFVVVN